MATVLITGANGFIGRPLAATLHAHGDTVHALDLAPDVAVPYEQHCDDLGSAQRLERLLRENGIDRVVHGAGVSGPLLARDAPFRVIEANVFGSLNLLEAARRAGIARLVNLSSAAACGPTDGLVGDDAERRPVDVYGASKAAVELMYAAYAECLSLSAVTLRLPTVYGPGSRMSCVVATMISESLAQRPVNLAWGRGYACPYLFVDDAVAAIRGALDAPAPPLRTYNISGPEHVAVETIKELVEQHIPGARISLGAGPPLPGYARGRMDIRAAQRDLGYRPRVDIASGVARCVAWLRTMQAGAAGVH